MKTSGTMGYSHGGNGNTPYYGCGGNDNTPVIEFRRKLPGARAHKSELFIAHIRKY